MAPCMKKQPLLVGYFLRWQGSECRFSAAQRVRFDVQTYLARGFDEGTKEGGVQGSARTCMPSAPRAE